MLTDEELDWIFRSELQEIRGDSLEIQEAIRLEEPVQSMPKALEQQEAEHREYECIVCLEIK